MTIVFLVYNRRDELKTSLEKMLFESDYDSDLVDVIVVDNASTDRSAEMVSEHFPQVRLIRRETNVGTSGWNDGFDVAEGDYVLVLDDDCYLPPDGLRRAVLAASAHGADLVSFRVASTHDPTFVFSDDYRTGLFSFWGCAALIRRRVLEQIGGYDPEIFVWAHELEFMLRFFDAGFRHLHLPEVTAQHMKRPPEGIEPSHLRTFRINAGHWGYIAGKQLRGRDSIEALIALCARALREALRADPARVRGVSDTVRGFVRGIRHRDPVKNPEVSRVFRRDFETFASPWWLSRSPVRVALDLPRELARGQLRYHERPPVDGRFDAYFEERALLYPTQAGTLEF